MQIYTKSMAMEISSFNIQIYMKSLEKDKLSFNIQISMKSLAMEESIRFIKTHYEIRPHKFNVDKFEKPFQKLHPIL